MKRTISLLILIALVVSIFAACSAEETEPAFEIYRVSKEETTGFSYEKEAEAYLSDDVEFAGETEIKQDGFFNITRCDISDTFEAYERAKLECTISYDQVSIFYDSTLDMWKIYFFTKETNGNSGDVASAMIDNEVPVDTVKEVLGHTQINSMKPYIRISKNKLALCALNFEGIDVMQEELL